MALDHGTSGRKDVGQRARPAALPAADRAGGPVGRELDEPPPALLRAVKLAVRAEREPVDAIGVAAQLRHCFAGVIERQQLSAVDRAEQHRAAGAVPDHAADRPLVRPGDSFKLPSHSRYSYQTGTPGISSRVRNTL